MKEQGVRAMCARAKKWTKEKRGREREEEKGKPREDKRKERNSEGGKDGRLWLICCVANPSLVWVQ